MSENISILVVDDSPVQAILLRRVLTHAGYDVTTAKNGLEALEFLKKATFDLVISDVNMPKMDGYTLCKEIKKNPAYAHMPVMLCTVLSDPSDLIRGIEVGADNYITRPWHEGNLICVVQEMIKESLRPPPHQESEEVIFNGQNYHLNTSRQHILNFLLSTYRNIHLQNQELLDLREKLQKAYAQLESTQKEQEQILLKIFPESVAQELLAYGSVSPARYDDVTIMFVDFVGFTKSSKDMSAQNLVEALEYYFERFDEIVGKHDLERIKTMGDGYMCVGGLTTSVENHALNCTLAAIEIQKFVKDSANSCLAKYGASWSVRIGINTGSLVAGVIGKKRPAYDIWGVSVNLASRMEAFSEAGKINISESTYEKIKDRFICQPRGTISVANKPSQDITSEEEDLSIKMFFVEGIKIS